MERFFNKSTAAFQVSFHPPIGISYQHHSIRYKIYFSSHDIIKAFNFRVIEIYGINRLYTTINLGTILLNKFHCSHTNFSIPPTPSLQLLRSNCTLPSTVPEPNKLEASPLTFQVKGVFASMVSGALKDIHN